MLRRRAAGTVARMRSRLPLLALVAAAAAALTAQPASAARSATYTVAFTGSVNITWKLPKYQTAQDCYRTSWFAAGGEMNWNVRSTGTNKVLVTDNGYATQFHYGGWDQSQDTGHTGLEAKGEVMRSHYQGSSFTAGTCGTLQLPVIDPPEKDDCGTRLVKYEVVLSNKGREITPDVLAHGNGIREKIDFDNCPVSAPDNILVGSWPPVSGKIMRGRTPVRGYFGSERSFTASGKWSETATADVQGGAGHITSTVKVKWTATFTRVR
jgi:hypothetical protein